MINIEKLQTGELYIRLNEAEVIEESIGKELFAVIKEYLNSSAKIIIDLAHIKSINPDGFHYLQKIMKEALDIRATIYFSNAVNTLEELIESLTLTDES